MTHPTRNAPAAAVPAPPAKKPRDMRLDFFRGLAMFIILLAHVPLDSWALWIPARFGFSDATEIFVFCSGLASSLAFGAAFRDHGWPMGTARIAHRVWQVYWAHVGLVLAVCALLYAIDASGWGAPDKLYIARVPVVPLFEDTGPALLGLLSLRWVPNFFDILPMYLVILAMVPLVMGAFRLGGRGGALGLVAAIWLAAQFNLLDLPSRPWATEIPWFFNPFGWQLVFFTGFAFGMGWVPAPLVSRALFRAAAAVLLISVPFAWFRIHDGLWLPDGWWLQDAIAAGREATQVLWRKTELGLFRWLHFLALAYVFWSLAGPGGARLTQPLRLPGAASGAALAICAGVALITAPWAWVDEIRAVAPALDAWLTGALGEGARSVLGFDLFVPWERQSLVMVLHLCALTPLVWTAIGAGTRAWIAGPGWAGFVPVVRKVGTQSLAVFLSSMFLAQVIGWGLDLTGRGLWATGLFNLAGFAALIAVAYAVGWFKSQPWRHPAPAPAPTSRTAVSRTVSPTLTCAGVLASTRRASARVIVTSAS